jgi:ketosteroid isomerase-like protein
MESSGVPRDTARAMSQENVEIVRRYCELLNETGEPPLDLVDHDVEMHMFEGSPIRGPYRGHQGLQQWREDTFDVIEDWRVELDDVVTGDDPNLVVAFQRFVGRARHTDLEVDFPLAVVVRFRAGLISGFEGYRKRREALEAAGLSE